MIRRTLVALALVAVTPLANAQQLECGTSEERTLIEMKRAEWLQRAKRSRIRGEASSPSVRWRDGVFIVGADDDNAPFRRPFDLQGRTLRFTPTDRGTYAVDNLPVAWDATPATRNFGGETLTSIKLSFAFPFAGGTHSEFTTNNIAALTPKGSSLTRGGIAQLPPHELASLSGPVIAPFINTTPGRIPAFGSFAENADGAVFSWTNATTEIQAKLYRTGVIDFSYRKGGDELSGGIMISTGNEPWREGTVILEKTDAVNDVTVGALDVEKVTVRRLPEAGLLELRATLREAYDRTKSGDVIYDFEFGGGAADVALLMRANGNNEAYTPGWAWTGTGAFAKTDGRDVVLRVEEDLIGLTGNSVPLILYVLNVGANEPAEAIEMTVNLPGARTIATDFSNVTASRELAGPVLESFTLTPLSIPVIWSQMKNAHGLKDADYDGVITWQTFTTDIVFTATAYALGGNPAVSNIHATRTNMGPQFAKTPTLMHMNRIGIYGDEKFATRLMLHEFGHRWLQSLRLKEGTENTRVLNPSTNHPAQYVHTPAAFPVYGEWETSSMGGGHFLPMADGRWSNQGVQGHGYSWLDLYLMGLADANEVLPFFYLANSTPKLGNEYFAPSGVYVGTKKDVAMQQVLDAMGTRNPAFPNTQRTFKMLFVLVTPDGNVSDADLAKLQALRTLMAKNFRTATGGRGELITEWTPPASGPRRRSVRR